MVDRHWAHLIAVSVVLVGAVNAGVYGLAKWNPLQSLLGLTFSRLIYVVIALCALYVGLQRETYLPFLGETVVPCSVLKDQVPEHADTAVQLHGLTPGKKVLFWAAERLLTQPDSLGNWRSKADPSTDGLGRIKDWRRAYLEFANAGVTTVDDGGHATLNIRKPQPYTVPIKGRLETHVHWRICGDNGFLGPVEMTPVP
jgi:uncharacterized membrane protein YuzA (DUF378 family)